MLSSGNISVDSDDNNDNDKTDYFTPCACAQDNYALSTHVLYGLQYHVQGLTTPDSISP